MKSKQKFLSLFSALLFLAPGSLSAQATEIRHTVSGKVTDSETKEALSGVTITLHDEKSRGTVTDTH
jgi:hypothetical protein